jgi:tetratricopeptide (TPR) repeat protein
VGRREEALAPAQEAVEVYRRLAQANPAAHEPDLAGALSNLGASLAQVGRREEALAPAQEAVTIRRRLAQANPDTHEPDLAMALWAFAWGQVLGDKETWPSALEAATESVAIYGQLALAMPRAYSGYLLAALTTKADLLDGLGRTAEASRIRTQLAQDSDDTGDKSGG